MTLNTFSAAAVAFPTSGPRAADYPAPDAPKKVAKTPIKTLSGDHPY
jgi:hypothetical protein